MSKIKEYSQKIDSAMAEEKVNSAIQNKLSQTANNELQNKLLDQDTERIVSILKHSMTLEEFSSNFLKTVTPVDFNELALEYLDVSLFDGEKERPPTQKEAIVIIIEHLMKSLEAYRSGVKKLDGEIHLYVNTHWQPLKKDELERFLGAYSQLLEYDLTNSKFFAFSESLWKQLNQRCPLGRRENTKMLVNFLNGTLEISEEGQKLAPHLMSDDLTYCLSFHYEAKAEAKLFEAYLRRVLPDEESQTVLAEFLGWIFLRDLKLEKMLVLYGGGHNGKSVLFDIINALLGEDNISCVGLSSINKLERRSALLGKLLNYASEIGGNISPDLLKQIASGERVEFRHLFKDNFSSDNYARLAFNTNTLPTYTEMTLGYFRRFLIIPFEQVITSEEKDPDLAKKIIATELSGVMNWILEGANRLRLNRKFSPCKKSDECLARYQTDSDNVSLFIEEYSYVRDNSGSEGHKDLYREYRENFCENYGYKPCSTKTFEERMKHHGFHQEKDRQKKKVWLIRAESPPEDEAM